MEELSLGLRVESLGFRVESLGFRVEGLKKGAYSGSTLLLFVLKSAWVLLVGRTIVERQIHRSHICIAQNDAVISQIELVPLIEKRAVVELGVEDVASVSDDRPRTGRYRPTGIDEMNLGFRV